MSLVTIQNLNVLCDSEKLDRIITNQEKLMALFDALRAQVKKLTDASEAMDLVLQDVKKKLDAAIANAGSLSDADKADLQAISDGLGTEADKIVADTLANTPAAPTP